MEIPSAAGSRGAATALVWIKREDDPDEVLFYGTQNGYLICWKQTKSLSTVSVILETD